MTPPIRPPDATDPGSTPPPDGAAARRSRAAPAPVVPRKPRGRWLRRLAALILAGVVASAAGAAWLRWQLAPTGGGVPGAEVVFEVEPGWGASRVAGELEAYGLIRDARVFSLYLQLRDLDRRIGEGLYDLDPAMGAAQLAEALAAGGRPRVVEVLLPEGLRATEVAARLAGAGFGEVDAIAARIADPDELRPGYLPPDAGLEGYLFPAGYELRVDATPDQVLERMLERFEVELDGDVVEALDALGLSVHQWVILGSMVQAEAGGSDEMPIIAGVFLNRLDLGMPLQSDPTVAYGLGKALPELSALAGDLQRDHPWNTYTRPALPAGPIGNPGSDALTAVLNAERTTADGDLWLYFLHGVDDGEIVFRPNTSLEAHNRDVERYLR